MQANRTEPRAVVFDVDGVLIDSYRAHFESWRMIAAEYGRAPYTEAEFRAGFGRTSREVLAAQWPPEFLAPDRVREIDERKEALYRDLAARDFPAMPGAEALIRALHAAGFRLAVGSSGPPPNVDLVVDRLGVRDLLGAIVTGIDVTRGKPDPQVFLLAAERLDVPPSRCLVFEDAPVGVAAARAAGMRCIGVLSTGRTPEDVRAADHVVRTLEEADVALVSRILG